MKHYPNTEGAAQDNAQFTGQEWDGETATTHFQYRQYSATQGRWMSPDPYDGSYNPFNPQSFNRYAYALNNPLSFIDPSGQYCEYTADSGGDDGAVESVDYNSSENECSRTGGNWFPDGWGSAAGGIGGIYSGGVGTGVFAPGYADSGLSHPGAPSNVPSKTACFARGVAVGAGGGLLVAGAAAGAVALGAPAAVVTGGLLLAGGVGGGLTAASTYNDIRNGNYAGATYSAGSVVGGVAVGGAVGGAVGDGINPPASRGWSIGGDWANRFNPGLGSVGKWLGTGPDAAAAGGSIAGAASKLAALLRGPC